MVTLRLREKPLASAGEHHQLLKAIEAGDSQAARDVHYNHRKRASTELTEILEKYRTFTRGMAKELGPSGIRVNCVCPGMISTTFHDTFTKDEVRANVAAATPIRREGKAPEVAELVVFLASPASSFVTGASVDINGGMFFS